VAAARNRRGAARGGPPRAPRLAHAPEQGADPVLAEEGLALEDHRRHAPVARRAQRGVIGREHPFVPFRVGGDRGLHLHEVEAHLRGDAGQMVPLVPPFDAAVPEHPREQVAEAEPLPTLRRRDAEPAEPPRQRVVRRGLQRHRVLHHRVRARALERQATIGGRARRIEHEVRPRDRVHHPDVVRVPQQARMDHAHRDVEGPSAGEVEQPLQGDVGIRAAAGPVEIHAERHGLGSRAKGSGPQRRPGMSEAVAPRGARSRAMRL
jgi:hypothetical protein